LYLLWLLLAFVFQIRCILRRKPPTKAILRKPRGLPTFVATNLRQKNGITKEKTGPGGNVPFVGTVRIGRVEPPIILRRTWFGAAHF
jgi:hypothetical protein